MSQRHRECQCIHIKLWAYRCAMSILTTTSSRDSKWRSAVVAIVVRVRTVITRAPRRACLDVNAHTIDSSLRLTIRLCGKDRSYVGPESPYLELEHERIT